MALPALILSLVEEMEDLVAPLTWDDDLLLDLSPLHFVLNPPIPLLFSVFRRLPRSIS